MSPDTSGLPAARLGIVSQFSPVSRLAPVAWLTLATLTVLGCDASPPPVPDVEPFRDFVDVVQFGQSASEIRSARPLAVNDAGELMEVIGSDDWLYIFDRKADSVPPPPRAQLIGIQMRKEFWDTTGLWTAWTERSARFQGFTGAAPVCSRVTNGRLTTTRADFPGPVQLSAGVQILLGEDGQSFESWLISGAELAAPDSVSEVELEAGRVDCGAGHLGE